MKKLLLISALSLVSAARAFAQNAIKYGDLIVYRPFLDRYVAELHVDGNVKTRFAFLRDQAGNKLKFASEADALNYVCKQGWELVSSYYHSQTHFILKKS